MSDSDAMPVFRLVCGTNIQKCLILKGIIEVERVKGIEPSSQAWEAHILPLNHTRTGLTLPCYQTGQLSAILVFTGVETPRDCPHVGGFAKATHQPHGDTDNEPEILRETGMHWLTLKKILTHSEPPGYRLRKARPKQKLGP